MAGAKALVMGAGRIVPFVVGGNVERAAVLVLQPGHPDVDREDDDQDQQSWNSKSIDHSVATLGAPRGTGLEGSAGVIIASFGPGPIEIVKTAE